VMQAVFSLMNRSPAENGPTHETCAPMQLHSVVRPHMRTIWDDVLRQWHRL
jgi:hypothetical protein